MVERQLRRRGVRDERVLSAMAAIPRHRFVPDHARRVAYADSAQGIAAGQTISQPYVVALMAEALDLQPGDRVLEVGAGSGYAAAVLGELAEQVWGVERHEELVREARATLGDLGVDNVHIVHGDGFEGWPAEAPYEAISVAAATPTVPTALLEQLADGGRLVLPLGNPSSAQELRRIRRRGDDFEEKGLGGVRFVPLVQDT